MAVAAINPVRGREKKDALDKIAAGLNIAQGVLGVTLAIPEAIAKGKERKLEREYKGLQIGAERQAQQPLTQEQIAALDALNVPKASRPVNQRGFAETIKMMTLTPGQQLQADVLKATLEQRAQETGIKQKKEERESAKFEREMAAPVLTPAELEVDKKFAADYAEFIPGGGRADVEKGINQLKGVLDELKSKKANLTGPDVGLQPTKLRAQTNPESVAAQDAVEEVVQRNLRVILGAQFTEKEGERLIARAYNIWLDEDENARRVERLLKQMEEAKNAKQAAADYFQQNGTLKGFTGKLYQSADDFLADEKDPQIEEYAKKNSLTYSQAQRIIEARRGQR